MKRLAWFLILLAVSCSTEPGSMVDNRPVEEIEKGAKEDPEAINNSEEQLSQSSMPSAVESTGEEAVLKDPEESKELVELVIQEKPEEPVKGDILSEEISAPEQPEEKNRSAVEEILPAPIEIPEAAGFQSKGTILIDPGHGGSDPGAMAGGWTEKYLNGRVSFFLGELLQQAGFRVRYTRPPLDLNAGLKLDQRVNEMNRSPFDLMISIHHNASFKSEPHGFSILYSSYRPLTDQTGVNLFTKGKVYPWVREEIRDNVTYMYYRDGTAIKEIHGNHVYTVVDNSPGEDALESLRFAESLFQSLDQLTHVEPQYMSGRDRPIQSKENRVIRLINGPAIIVECGYMTNPGELQQLIREGNQRATAEALFHGIMNYLNKP